MRKSLLDILACPIDKHYPLELYEINTVSDPSVNESIIKEGILFCSECSRFYPIMDEIPVMLPDELREKEKDIEFLKTWHDQIPDKIINYGNSGSKSIIKSLDLVKKGGEIINDHLVGRAAKIISRVK